MARKTKPAPAKLSASAVPAKVDSASKGSVTAVGKVAGSGSKQSHENMKVLKATIVRALGEEQSQQMEQDPAFSGHGNIIHPPYPTLHLSTLRENNTELGQCVDAMVTNIDGFGYRLVETAMDEAERTAAIKKEVLAERGNLEGFLDNVNFDEDITKLRKSTRQDTEETGDGWWEIIPYAKKAGVSSLMRIEPHLARWTKMDKEFTEARIKYYNKSTKKMEERRFKKRFRRIAHKVAEKIVYLKEWGDPRDIDPKTGQAVTNGTLKDGTKVSKPYANSAKTFGAIKSSRTPYCLPRFIGNLFSIYGSRSADEINFVTFENNNIPSMIILVSNGQLTGDSVKRVEEFIETRVAGNSNRSSVLIIEAEPAEEGQINPGTMKMEIKDVSGAQKEDQLFQDYDKNNGEKVRRSFRLPPIFVGKSEDYNRSTAQESRKLADEQVFSPERGDFDVWMNRFLRTEFNMKHHTFKSNSANVTNDQDLVKILGTDKAGAVSPNLAVEVMSDVLGREIPKYDKDKHGFDPDIPLSLTLVGLAGATAGNQQTGTVAPNSGQVPKQPVAKADDGNAFEKIEKILLHSLGIELGIDPLADALIHPSAQFPDDEVEK